MLIGHVGDVQRAFGNVDLHGVKEKIKNDESKRKESFSLVSYVFSSEYALFSSKTVFLTL